MPIYEYHCSKCNVIFNFLSKTVKPAGSPSCPRCRKPRLERQVSMFAATGNAKENSGEGDLPIDDARMEKAVEALASEADGMNEDDPRQAAALMRKFSKATGLELTPGMGDAMNRLEAGEDPDVIEKEMGDELGADQDPFILPGGKKADRKVRRPPTRDSKLYDL